MKWFQRDSLFEDIEREHAAYAVHLSALEPRLTADLKTLTQTNLHDALVEALEIDEAGRTVVLRLISGEMPTGYYRVRGEYSNATLTVVGADLRWLVNSTEVELLYDELDQSGPASFEHRMLFWPAGELHIGFDEVRIQRIPLRERTREPSSERLHYR